MSNSMWRRWWTRGLLPVALVSLAACGGGGGGGVYDPPALDLVVLANRTNAVLIFRDATHKGPAEIADVVLTSTSSGVDRPTGVFVDGDRLFVSNYGASTVTIYDGFATLASNAPPAVTLNVSSPNRLVVAGGDLYVSSNNGYVYVWRDVASVGDGQAEDLVLYNGGSSKDVIVEDDSLYVAAMGNDEVLVYRNASTLASDNGPDVVLDLAGSIVNDPVRLAARAGRLYVSNRYNALLIFNDAAGLVDGQAPDVVLGGPSQLDGVRRPVLDDQRLYVPNLWVDDDEPVISIFDDPLTLVNGNVPDATISNQLESCNAIDLLDGVLAAADRYGDGVVHLWFQAGAMETNQPSDLELWDPRMSDEGVPEIVFVRR